MSLDDIRTALRKRWGRHTKKWIWGQVFFIWGLAQVLPIDVLDQIPILRSICAPIVSTVALIPGYIARSSFPQVTELVFCLGWLLVSVNIVFGILFPEYMSTAKPKTIFGDLRDLKPESTNVFGLVFATAIMLVLIPVLIWMVLTVPLFDVNYKYGTVDDHLHSHTIRITFGFFVQAFSNLLGIAAGAWIVLCGHLFGFISSAFSK